MRTGVARAVPATSRSPYLARRPLPGTPLESIVVRLGTRTGDACSLAVVVIDSPDHHRQLGRSFNSASSSQADHRPLNSTGSACSYRLLFKINGEVVGDVRLKVFAVANWSEHLNAMNSSALDELEQASSSFIRRSWFAARLVTARSESSEQLSLQYVDGEVLLWYTERLQRVIGQTHPPADHQERRMPASRLYGCQPRKVRFICLTRKADCCPIHYRPPRRCLLDAS